MRFSQSNTSNVYTEGVKTLMSQSKRNAYSITVLTFLAVSLFLWYAVRPTLQTIIYLKREIRDLEEVNTKMEDKINKLIETQATLDEYQEPLQALGETIPNNPNILLVMKTIQDLVKTTESSISSFQIEGHPLYDNQYADKIQNQDVVEALPLRASMTLSGNYYTLSSLIPKLLSYRRIFMINSFSLSPLSSRTKTNTTHDTVLLLSFDIIQNTVKSQ